MHTHFRVRFLIFCQKMDHLCLIKRCVKFQQPNQFLKFILSLLKKSLFNHLERGWEGQNKSVPYRFQYLHKLWMEECYLTILRLVIWNQLPRDRNKNGIPFLWGDSGLRSDHPKHIIFNYIHLILWGTIRDQTGLYRAIQDPMGPYRTIKVKFGMVLQEEIFWTSLFEQTWVSEWLSDWVSEWVKKWLLERLSPLKTQLKLNWKLDQSLAQLSPSLFFRNTKWFVKITSAK